MQVDEDILRRHLESIVRDKFNPQSAIIDIQWRPSDYSSWYLTYIVSIRLANGEELKIFLKDYSRYKRVRERMAQRRRRELYVYRNLLVDANLGTPMFYGSVWEEVPERFWLFLEFVSGMPILHRNYKCWGTAAGWLGRLQGYFSQRMDLLRSCEVLLRYDADFFASIAESALRTAYQISSDFGNRLRPIVDQYDKVVEAMVSQPETFVHGSYRPNHILLDESFQPPRVSPVDWESAGVGSTLLDLAFLAYQTEPEYLDLIFDAYRSEAFKYGIQVCDKGKMKYIVDCYRLHKVMDWLSKSLSWSFPEKVIIKLVGMAETEGHLVL